MAKALALSILYGHLLDLLLYHNPLVYTPFLVLGWVGALEKASECPVRRRVSRAWVFDE
jgi:hypothetical protein